MIDMFAFAISTERRYSLSMKERTYVPACSARKPLGVPSVPIPISPPRISFFSSVPSSFMMPAFTSIMVFARPL